jgi:ribosome biogenesis GTPase / thiamine phosphate phosphatase
MENISLNMLGWSHFFESQIQSADLPQNFLIARVTAENKTNYNLACPSGDFIGEVTGKILFNAASESDLPKTGDWVAFTEMDQGKALIHHIFNRKTVVSRKAVGRTMTEQIIITNVDVLFIVQSLDNNFNISRLERYVSATSNDIEPIIVLNKADLCSNLDERLAEVTGRLSNVKVIATSYVNNDLNSLQAHIVPGKTYAFVGSSGVGKSSLINRLLGENMMETGAVRDVDSKGRHTTTRRELILIPEGGILIDTPGMREFGLWSEHADLSTAFGDIAVLASRCKYSDCQHINEQHCAVKEAVDQGVLDSSHYQNYLKLKREVEYQEALYDPLKAQQKKKAIKVQQRALNKIVRKKH